MTAETAWYLVAFVILFVGALLMHVCGWMVFATNAAQYS